MPEIKTFLECKKGNRFTRGQKDAFEERSVLSEKNYKMTESTD